MSLTGLLKKDNSSHHAKELRAIITTITPSKEKFKTLNSTPPFSNNAILSAPYSFTDFKYASISGTAFDYLARILISKYTGNNLYKNKNGHYDFFAKNGLDIIDSPTITDKYSKSMFLIDNYFSGDIDGTEIIKTCIFLAYIESVARGGINDFIIDSLFSPPPEEIINDLKNLGNTFYKSFIKPKLIGRKNFIIYNPRYSELTTSLLGGIDADLLIGNTLYDFKTTKNNYYNLDHSMQMTGYYLFYLLDKALSLKSILNKTYIKKLAFYKSRTGIVEYVDCSSFDKNMVKNSLKEIIILFNYCEIDSKIEERLNAIINI
ncbi:hypothetical protein OHW66_03465 [Acinetobacter baumannii]|nr:hypothetical protein [Acinetobacter baumannii]